MYPRQDTEKGERYDKILPCPAQVISESHRVDKQRKRICARLLGKPSQKQQKPAGESAREIAPERLKFRRLKRFGHFRARVADGPKPHHERMCVVKEFFERRPGHRGRALMQKARKLA